MILRQRTVTCGGRSTRQGTHRSTITSTMPRVVYMLIASLALVVSTASANLLSFLPGPLRCEEPVLPAKIRYS